MPGCQWRRNIYITWGVRHNLIYVQEPQRTLAMADNQALLFRSILSYCTFIILGPIMTFFFTKVVIFEGVFRSASIASNVWSAVAAVVVLHVALGMFIMKAYSDANKVPPKDDKVD